MENRFEYNRGFRIEVSGYYSFVNISSNNFTDNAAASGSGIVSVIGMEKNTVIERNRFTNNWGHWMLKIESSSQSIRSEGREMSAFVQYNYFQFNRFLRPPIDKDYTDMWPRSYAIGVFGTQFVEVHFNRLRNVLMDFEFVAGCKPQFPSADSVLAMNITHNWWGVPNGENKLFIYLENPVNPF